MAMTKRAAAGPRLTARSSNRAWGRAGGGGKEPRAHPGLSCGVGVVGGARELENSSPEVLGGRRLLDGAGVIVGGPWPKSAAPFDEERCRGSPGHQGEDDGGRWPRWCAAVCSGEARPCARFVSWRRTEGPQLGEEEGGGCGALRGARTGTEEA